MIVDMGVATEVLLLMEVSGSLRGAKAVFLYDVSVGI